MSNGYDTQPRFMWDVGADENQMKLITENLIKQQQRTQTGPGGERYVGRVPGGVFFGWRSPDLYYKSPLDSAGDRMYEAWGLPNIPGAPAMPDVLGVGAFFDKLKFYAMVGGLVALLGVGIYVGVKVGGSKKPEVVVVQQPAPATETKKAPDTSVFDKMPKEVQEGIRRLAGHVVYMAKKNWDEDPQSRETFAELVEEYRNQKLDDKYLRMAWDDLPDNIRTDIVTSFAHAMGEGRIRQG